VTDPLAPCIDGEHLRAHAVEHLQSRFLDVRCLLRVRLGALLGGALGQVVGLRLTLLVLGVGLLCAPLWLIFSPIPSLREPPAPVDG